MNMPDEEIEALETAEERDAMKELKKKALLKKEAGSSRDHRRWRNTVDVANTDTSAIQDKAERAKAEKAKKAAQDFIKKKNDARAKLRQRQSGQSGQPSSSNHAGPSSSTQSLASPVESLFIINDQPFRPDPNRKRYPWETPGPPETDMGHGA